MMEPKELVARLRNYTECNDSDIDAAADLIDRLTTPLPEEIEGIQKRHDCDNRPVDISKNRGWCESTDAWSQRIGRQANTDRATLLTALRASEARAAAAYEDAAKIADMYAETNMEQMGDSILLDPLLSGGGFTDENIRRSQNLAVDGCVHSSMFHAAQNIAAAIRAKSNGGK